MHSSAPISVPEALVCLGRGWFGTGSSAVCTCSPEYDDYQTEGRFSIAFVNLIEIEKYLKMLLKIHGQATLRGPFSKIRKRSTILILLIR